eukprot:IDg17966t1
MASPQREQVSQTKIPIGGRRLGGETYLVVQTKQYCKSKLLDAAIASLAKLVRTCSQYSTNPLKEARISLYQSSTGRLDAT